MQTGRGGTGNRDQSKESDPTAQRNGEVGTMRTYLRTQVEFHQNQLGFF
jgi:hypothetical protein